MNAISKDCFIRRLQGVASLYATRRGTKRERHNLPLALHAWPKNDRENYCGVGPVSWTDHTAESWWDVRVGPVEADHYHDLNRKLAQACAELHLPYFNAS